MDVIARVGVNAETGSDVKNHIFQSRLKKSPATQRKKNKSKRTKKK